MIFWHHVNKRSPSNKRIGFFGLALLVFLASVSLGVDTARAESTSWTIGGSTSTGSTFVATFNASADKDIYNPGEIIAVNANGSVQFSGSGLIVFALIIYTDVTGKSAAYTPCYQSPFSCSASLVAPTEPGIYYVKLEGYAGSVTPNTRYLRIVVPQPLSCGSANNTPTIGTGTPNSSLLCISGNATTPSLSGQTWRWSCSSPATGATVSCSAPHTAPPTISVSPASRTITVGQSANFTVQSSSEASNMDFDLILWLPPNSTKWSNGGISSTYAGGTVSNGSGGTGYSFFTTTNSHSTTYTFTPTVTGTYHFRGGARVGSTIYNSPLPGAVLNVCSADQTIVNGACTTPTSALPDLTAGSVTPATATVGVPTTLSAPIIISGGNTSTTFHTVFQSATDVNGTSPGNPTAGTDIAGLTTSASKSTTLKWTPSAAKTYYLRACADNDTSWNDLVTESDEDNNCGPWTAVTVAAACSSKQGTSCSLTSDKNACLQKTVSSTAGTYDCSGVCVGTKPAVPVVTTPTGATYGATCNPKNTCGQSSPNGPGTITCDGVCSVSAPADSSCPVTPTGTWTPATLTCPTACGTDASTQTQTCTGGTCSGTATTLSCAATAPCVVDACGPASDPKKPVDVDPSGTAACAAGTFKVNTPTDPLAWNWSCGSVTTCSAPKYGCTTTTDSHYNPSGPANDWGCALTCKNGEKNYPTCTPPSCTTGGPPCCAPAS